MNRLKRWVFASTLEQRRPCPGRDASRGERRAIRLWARSTGPRSALHLRQRTCRRLTAPTGRRAHFFIAEARPTERLDGRLCCLSSQSKRVHEPHSHALGRPATPLARRCRNRGQSRACARESRRWQATSERPEPSGSGRSTEVEHPSPVAALAEARPFPASGARPRKTMRVVRKATPFGEPRPRHVAKTTDTRCRFRVGAHLRRHVRPSNRSRGGQSRHDPTPMRLRRLLVETAPVIPRKPTVRANPHGF